jgi:hypothetical protein
LIKYWKELRGINGAFRVVSSSAAVQNILSMAGVLSLMEEKAAPVGGEMPCEGATERQEEGGRFTIYHPAPGESLSLNLIGRPARLAEAGFTAADCAAVALPRDAMAVGIGAFGKDFAECRGRFGEFLAAGGVTISFPTDGSGTPDDQVALGAFVPAVQALTAATCRGSFAHFFRFEPDEGGVSLPLSRLVGAALSLCGAPRVGLVLVAEADGLVGACLRRSPVADGASVFAFPEVRDWLSLTPERMYPRSLALVAGIAVQGDDPALAPYVRPLGGGTDLAGHLHAAVFSYRALRGGLLEMAATVAELMETQNLEGLLHLLNDERKIAGIGESRFIRGAAWAGPLTFDKEPSAAGGAA